MQQGTITVHPSLDGTPAVRWELDTEAAEGILTLLVRAALTDPDPQVLALVDHLSDALREAEDMAHPWPITGCPGLTEHAPPYTLNSPAVLGDDTDLRAVLLPGHVPMLKAITEALDEANASGANLDPHDTSLMADYHEPRWVLLHACAINGHDFHPELAPAGSQTPGAVLVTQVNFTHHTTT